MLDKLTVCLSEPEKRALQVMAQREMRGLRDQARFLLRAELERSGLLELPHEFTCEKHQAEDTK